MEIESHSPRTCPLCQPPKVKTYWPVANITEEEARELRAEYAERTLSEEFKADASRACSRFRGAVYGYREKWLEMAEALFEIEEKGYFKIWELQSFRQFLEGNEIFVNQGFAYDLTRMYEIFHKKHDISKRQLHEVKLVRLIALLPLVRDASRAEVLEWYKKAKSMPDKGFNDLLKAEKKKKKGENGE